jgi:hypothetical protein
MSRNVIWLPAIFTVPLTPKARFRVTVKAGCWIPSSQVALKSGAGAPLTFTPQTWGESDGPAALAVAASVVPAHAAARASFLTYPSLSDFSMQL